MTKVKNDIEFFSGRDFTNSDNPQDDGGFSTIEKLKFH